MVHSLLGAGLDLSVSAEPHSGRMTLKKQMRNGFRQHRFDGAM
jgi:hypothetical protein